MFTYSSKNRFLLQVASVPVFLFSIFYFLFPSVLFAANSLIPCSGANNIDNSVGAINNRECTFADLVTLAQNVAAKIVQIGLIITPIIIAYAGYLFLTSQDNPGKRTKARGIFLNVVIGFVIMMLAWVFVNLVLSALLCGSITNASWFPFAVSGGGGTGPGCTPAP